MRPLSILNVFNHYRLRGGEEYSVENICSHLSRRHEVSQCSFHSNEWTGPGAPGKLSQLGRLFYNPDGKRRFEAAVDKAKADLAMLHNIYPVGSPALYRSALKSKLPVIQFLHNYRPFSVGGSLYSRGRLIPEPLQGNYGREIREATWMNSVVRSAIMALLLKGLHRSGWLKSVTRWIAISDFMRERIVESGAVKPDRIVTLRHAWDSMPQMPERVDAGYYLFLGRLIEEKGIPPLLQAWDVLYHRLGRATPPLHIGGDGPLDALVKQHARTNPFICSLGKISGETKADELLRCRALIAPSVWWEPLGLVTYEAYDYAKPVLAAAFGGFTETVQHGNTGFLHQPGDAENLVQDLLNLEAMSVTQRFSMGSSGRHWLRQETNPTVWLKRFEEIVGDIVPNEPRA